MYKKRPCSECVHSDLDIQQQLTKKIKPAMPNSQIKTNGNGYPFSYSLPISNSFQRLLQNKNENNEHHKNNDRQPNKQAKLPPIVTKLNSTQI